LSASSVPRAQPARSPSPAPIPAPAAGTRGAGDGSNVRRGSGNVRASTQPAPPTPAAQLADEYDLGEPGGDLSGAVMNGSAPAALIPPPATCSASLPSTASASSAFSADYLEDIMGCYDATVQLRQLQRQRLMGQAGGAKSPAPQDWQHDHLSMLMAEDMQAALVGES